MCAQTIALGQCTALVNCSAAWSMHARSWCASLQRLLTNLTPTLHAQASLSQVLQSVQTGNTALLAGPSAAAVAAVGDSVARAFREALAKNLMPDLQRWVLPDTCHAPLQALPFARLATKCHQGPCLVCALLERALRWACQTHSAARDTNSLWPAHACLRTQVAISFLLAALSKHAAFEPAIAAVAIAPQQRWVDARCSHHTRG